MKILSILSICVLLIILTAFDGFGQRNFTLYHLEGTPQSHYLNPSFKPSSNVYISLPLGMQSIGVSHSGFALKHLFVERSQDDSLVLYPANAVSKMADINHVNLDLQNEIFGLGFRMGKKNYLSLSAMHRSQTNFLYSRDLMSFIFNGNGKEFLGKRANFDDLGVNFNSYVEYALGYNRVFGDDLMIGMRVKVLSGISNLQMKKSQLGIYTDEVNYNWTIDGQMEVNSSNLFYFMQPDSVHTDEFPANSAYNFKNFGLGFDLGGSYVFNDKFLLSASVLDLGFINWNTNVRNFSTNELNYTFQGVNINDFLTDSTSVFDNMVDSLDNLIGQNENSEKYTTSLYTKFFIGGRYQLSEKVGATFMLYNEIVNRRYRVGVNVGVNAKLNQWLSASVNYGYYGRSWSNLGLGLSLRGGPVQFYFGFDNVLPVFNISGFKNVHAVFGLGIMIGKPDKDKTPGSLKFK